jgi:hypothetical protein
MQTSEFVPFQLLSSLFLGVIHDPIYPYSSPNIDTLGHYRANPRIARQANPHIARQDGWKPISKDLAF